MTSRTAILHLKKEEQFSRLGLSALQSASATFHPTDDGKEQAMEYIPCEELDSLNRRLKYAIQRKNELIAANLSGRWMMAAEADLTRTNELLMNHSYTCRTCNEQWREVSQVKPRTEDVATEEELYPLEDPENPFRAPPRRMYHQSASVLQFPSTDRHP